MTTHVLSLTYGPCVVLFLSEPSLVIHAYLKIPVASIQIAHQTQELVDMLQNYS